MSETSRTPQARLDSAISSAMPECTCVPYSYGHKVYTRPECPVHPLSEIPGLEALIPIGPMGEMHIGIIDIDAVPEAVPGEDTTT